MSTAYIICCVLLDFCLLILFYSNGGFIEFFTFTTTIKSFKSLKRLIHFLI